MPLLFIGSTGDHAGQSIFTWAIARRLIEKGLTVGFVKPFGTLPVQVEGTWTDHDALLFKEVLHLREPLDRICPYLISDEAWRQRIPDEILREFSALARDLSEGKDVLLVMGSKHIFFDDSACSVTDIALIPELKADFLLITRYRKASKAVYSILSVSSLLREKVKGIILNRVPVQEMEMLTGQVIPPLRAKGIPISAALPEDPVLSYRSIREIREVLNGEILGGEGGMERPVGALTVGSVDLRGALLLFKRAYNKIVLLEPAATLPGAEESPPPRSVAGILLTSGRSPAPQLLEAAKKEGVPLLLVKEDTFAALERLEQSTSRLSSKDEFKVSCFTRLMDREGALDTLLQSLGLVP